MTDLHPFSRFSRYFLMLAKLGSLRRAAEALHVSASAIDRQVLLAEEELQTTLFERLPSGMKLTAAGELLLADLQRWSKEYGRTLERFDELQGLKRGHVSLAVIDALSEGLVARVLARLAADHPHLTFDLQVLDNRQVAERVAATEVDVGLLLQAHHHTGLDVRSSVEIAIGAVLPPDHALAAEVRLPISRLVGQRLLLPAAPLIVQEHARLLIESLALRERPALACNDVRMIRSLVREGAGVGILSLLDVAADLQDGRLAFVPLTGRGLMPLSLSLCTAPKRQLSKAAQLVLAALQAALEGFPEDVVARTSTPRGKRRAARTAA